MFLLKSGYGSYVKTISQDTYDIKSAKIFNDYETIYNYSRFYTPKGAYKIIKLEDEIQFLKEK